MLCTRAAARQHLIAQSGRQEGNLTSFTCFAHCFSVLCCALLGTGETVTMPLAPSYPVAISSALLQGLSKHTLTSGNITYDVAWLDGEISARANNTGSTGDASAPGSNSGAAAAAAAAVQGMDADPAFILLPPGSTAAAQDSSQQQQQHSGGSVLQGAGSAAAAAAANDEHVDGVEAMDIDRAAAASSGGSVASRLDDAAAAVVGDHGGIFIGDVKLSEVKQALAAVGVPSEFRGGRLVVGGSLVVRRDGPEGQLLMEGPLSDDYFKVRDVVYSQYNVC
jgi:hypothetical protein